MFKSLTIEQTRDVVQACQLENYKQGDVIVQVTTL
jgi:signal-transduction protein with cAMP-binding, CBS, and nucleotidyltransferase domain